MKIIPEDLARAAAKLGTEEKENVPTGRTDSGFDLDKKCFSVLRSGISHDEMLDGYEKWADTYDSDLPPGRYNGPAITAKAVADYYPENVRAGLKILDVAAGTGRVAVELRKLGFKKLDALEPCQAMVDRLLKSNLYAKTIMKPIGLRPIEEIAADAYDCLVICGGMGAGHIPVEAFDEMIRVVKPGGTIFNVTREEFISNVDQYKDRLEPHMQELEEEGLWKKLRREVIPEYLPGRNGIIFCYQVL